MFPLFWISCETKELSESFADCNYDGNLFFCASFSFCERFHPSKAKRRKFHVITCIDVAFTLSDYACLIIIVHVASRYKTETDISKHFALLRVRTKILCFLVQIQFM